MEDVLILAVESSCDETAAAVVKNGREVLSNVISSQIALHTLYGGVVPEIASRKHIEKINQVIEEALSPGRGEAGGYHGHRRHLRAGACGSPAGGGGGGQGHQFCGGYPAGGRAPYRGAHLCKLH